MNKRSAMLVAAGLVLTMIVGGVALAVGATGPASSAAAPRLTQAQRHPRPILKTIKRTVTVHKKAAPLAATVVTTTPVAASTSTSGSGGYTGSTGSSGDTSYGDDSTEDTTSEPSDAPEPTNGGGGDD